MLSCVDRVGAWQEAVRGDSRSTALAAVLVLSVFGAQGGVVFTTLHSFTVVTNAGGSPYAGLVQGRDGNFYGRTFDTVFQMTPAGVLTTLVSGFSLSSALVEGSDGYLYGTTDYGGTNHDGTVFKISTNGALTSLYTFTGGNDGQYPTAGLVQGRDGNFYGTTGGGTSRYAGGGPFGTVFKISTDGALTTLYSFTGNKDGANPQAGLVLGSDGNFYGTTQFGGTNNQGTVFTISTNGELTSLYSFTGGSDGATPIAALVQCRDGNFYGTTPYGGADTNPYGGGTVFKINNNGALTILHTFTVGDGYHSFAELVQGSDGYLYGTTVAGGTYAVGTVFQISTNGAFTTLYSFTGLNDGGRPFAGLVQGRDGNFYGMTDYGRHFVGPN